MIPIKLTIEGIYSYQKKQVIDFTSLMGGNIFGIFGSVGSGKSSILEAITFALYSNTQRLNISGDNRYYNMMNLKSDKLLIDFEFRTDNDNFFRFVVSSKRNSKNYDDVKSFTKSAYKKIGRDWEPTDNKAEDIIGLDYDNFIKTIIIPQGHFRDFLGMTDGDRTKLLKKIFDLYKYDLSFPTKSLINAANKTQENLLGQLQQIGDVSKEMIQEKENVLIDVNSKLVKHQESQKEISEKIKVFDLIKSLFDDLNKTNLRHKELIDLKEKYDEKENELDEYEQCVKVFEKQTNKYSDLQKDISKTEKSISAVDKTLKIIQEKKDQLEEGFIKVKKEYDNKDQHNKDIDALKSILNLQKLIENINNIEKSKSEYNKRIELSKDKIEELQLAKEALKQVVEDKKSLSENLITLKDIKNWCDRKILHNKDIDKANDSLQKVSEKLRIIKTEKQNIINKLSGDEPLFDNLSFFELLTIIDKRLESISTEIDTISEKESALNARIKLQDFAEHLEDGKPCPVCGSLSHPEPMVRADLDDMIAQLSINKIELKKSEKELSYLRNATEKAGLEFTNVSDSISDIDKEISDKNNDLQKHLESYIWTDYPHDNLANIKNDLVIAEKAYNDLKKLDKELSNQEKQIDKLQNESKGIEDNLKELNNELIKLNTQKDSLIELISKEYAEDNLSRDENVIQIEIEELETLIRDIEEKYIAFEKDIKDNQSEIDGLTGELKQLQNSFKEKKKSRESTWNIIQQLLTDSDYDSLEIIESILNKKIDSKKIRSDINEYKRELHSTTEKLSDLKDKIADREYDRNEHNQLIEELEGIVEQINTMQKEIGGLEKVIGNLKVDLNKSKELNKQLEKINSRIENLKTLAGLFKANGFVNYALSFHLQEITVFANKRFSKLTNNRLNLELTNDNDFQIRDFMNNGKVRSIKTLSGGQSFQVSLSLALALADKVQQQLKAEKNFFFIDEGFGTLDDEALESVFQTLRSLSSEDKIIGVISHVESLKQNIELYLNVVNHKDNGSIIRYSWE